MLGQRTPRKQRPSLLSLYSLQIFDPWICAFGWPPEVGSLGAGKVGAVTGRVAKGITDRATWALVGASF